MNNDEKYINNCFELAKKGAGFVSPNPLVGTVIVKDEKIIGEGYHKKYGEAHAEVDAIKNSNEDLEGATLYCNLEPCCHKKKQTPPCVPQIINSGIKRVVVSNIDPNVNVNGMGLKQLSDAGIKVVSGVREEEGKELNKFYFKFVKENLPYVNVKIAQSLDGKIAEEKNKQTWLTGKEAVKYVHQLRAEYDAVLIGANTVNVDNPQLTVRELERRNPVRIIVDGKLSINLNSKIFNLNEREKTWIVTSHKADKSKINQLKETGIKIISLADDDSVLNMRTILKKLGEEKITSLLVEGGANIFNQFIDQNLFDELTIIQSPNILGKGIPGCESEKIQKLITLQTNKLGSDMLITYKNQHN